MTRSDIESFFRTLLLGDFEENQNTAAQLVGGLISLVPVLDQVMDARDITGALFNINKRGGFNNATTDQLVNLGFAAFGAVPEIGSAFKTVFKPLWKERQFAKSAVNGGLQAIESLLHLGKGGAIGWIRKEILAKWGPRTSQAIAAVQTALAACIELTEFLATASGWKDWLIPDSIQELAKEVLPRLKSLQGQINAPLQRGSEEIRHFLEDLLGEQAAAVVMAAGQTAVAASAVPGTRTRSGHNAADTHPRGSAPTRHADQKVQDAHKLKAEKAAGPVHAAVQVTSRAFRDLARMEKGLVGEHMADYHELKRLGGGWTHDEPTGQWKPESVRKLNADKRPVNLSLEDLAKMRNPRWNDGIDAVWQQGAAYTVTEAKARESVFAVVAQVRSLSNKGLLPAPVKSLSADLQNLWLVLSKDNADVVDQGFPLVQMSDAWIKNRAPGENLPPQALAALETFNCHRRVLLITLESTGAPDHGQALVDLHRMIPPERIHPHPEHGVCRDWGDADIDKVVDACARAHQAKATRKASTSPPPDKPSKPGKPRKGA